MFPLRGLQTHFAKLGMPVPTTHVSLKLGRLFPLRGLQTHFAKVGKPVPATYVFAKVGMHVL